MTMKTFRISTAKTLFCAALLLSTAADAQTTITQLGQPINLDDSLAPRCSFLDKACIETSGLSLSNRGNTLWTIHDKRDWTMYKMRFNGEPSTGKNGNFKPSRKSGATTINEPDFEGIAYACKSGEDCSNSHFIYVIDENLNSIIPIQYHEKKYHDDKKIANMVNADQTLPNDDEVYCGKCKSRSLKDCLIDAGNSGLEGITFSPTHNSFFVLKEKDPGLLMKVSADLKTIQQVWGMALGDSCGNTKDADYSGIAFDRSRCTSTADCKMWLISDEAQKVYLLDLSDSAINGKTRIDSNNVVTMKDLGHKCSEGVAYDPDTNKLYIAVDGGKGAEHCKIPGNHSYLYTYDVSNSGN